MLYYETEFWSIAAAKHNYVYIAHVLFEVRGILNDMNVRRYFQVGNNLRHSDLPKCLKQKDLAEQ